MPRPCSICTGASRALPEEDLPKINERLRARKRNGESIAGIARDFGVSDDALGRHARHLYGGKKKGDDDLCERLLLMQTRCDELYERAIAVDDIRAATDVMAKLTAITDNLARLQGDSSSSRFRSMSVEEKVADLLAGGKIPSQLVDAISTILCNSKPASEPAQRLHKRD